MFFQAKAKDAAVVIVGTHVDKILRRQRIQVCEDLHKLIQTNYCSGSPYYPDIKGIKFVACPDSGQSRTDLQPIIELRKYLYDIASSMMVTIGRFIIICDVDVCDIYCITTACTMNLYTRFIHPSLSLQLTK